MHLLASFNEHVPRRLSLIFRVIKFHRVPLKIDRTEARDYYFALTHFKLLKNIILGIESVCVTYRMHYETNRNSKISEILDKDFIKFTFFFITKKIFLNFVISDITINNKISLHFRHEKCQNYIPRDHEQVFENR